jgi:hypothetical protein
VEASGRPRSTYPQPPHTGGPTGPFVIQGDDHDQENSETSQASQTNQTGQTGQGCETGRTGKKEPTPSRGRHGSRRQIRNCWQRPPRRCTCGWSRSPIRKWRKSRPSFQPVACMPTAKDWCRTSRLTCTANCSWPHWPTRPRGQIRTRRPKTLPRTWDDLVPGHLVIARETLEIGWWEAIVVERNGDLVTVRYRDYPQYPPMVRHRSAIALISPAAK